MLQKKKSYVCYLYIRLTLAAFNKFEFIKPAPEEFTCQ